MSESTTGTPALNKALAALQAELPHVGKDKTAKAGQYSYDYADLSDVTGKIMPLLGKHHLAFSARPTLTEGGFVLAYSLLHESGEAQAGEYPLPSSGTPQQVGSAITYARRYCLCAVTGLAPGGDDDDGEAANGVTMQMSRPRSAGDAWDGAQPARPAQSQPRTGNGQSPSSRAAQRPQRPAQPPADDALLGSWAQKLDEITSQEDAGEALAELDRQHKNGVIDSRREGAIKRAIKDKAAGLNGPDQPPQQDTEALTSGSDDGGQWISDFRTRLAKAPEDTLTAMRREVGQAVLHRKITPDASATLTAAVNDRRRELEGARA